MSRRNIGCEDATDEATRQLLPRRARTFGTLSIAGMSGPLRFGAAIVASGVRYDSVANSPSSRMAGYALVNLRAAYAFSPGYAVSVRWNNVFNKDYELVRGYNTPGSNVFISLEYTAP